MLLLCYTICIYDNIAIITIILFILLSYSHDINNVAYVTPYIILEITLLTYSTPILTMYAMYYPYIQPSYYFN